MAEIVNGATSVRKKDLYDHKSFSELYDYNTVIGNLRAASKKAFIQYINSGLTYWKSRYVANDGDFSVPLLAEDGGIDFFAIPLTNLTEEFESNEDRPANLVFSLIEITDPMLFKFGPNRQTAAERLEHYTELGLFPMITTPMEEQTIFDVFEKYDEVRPGGRVIGTIIDVFTGMDGAENEVIYANVMWDIYFTHDYPPTMFVSRSGYLKLANAVPTPEVWRDTNEVASSNFAIPYYEFQSYEAMADIIAASPQLLTILNTMVLTGQVHIDYLDYLVKKLHDVQEKLPSSVVDEDIAETSEPTDIIDVPREDAVEEDELGHRMHLYDEPSLPFEPASISDGIAELSTDEVLNEF